MTLLELPVGALFRFLPTSSTPDDRNRRLAHLNAFQEVYRVVTQGSGLAPLTIVARKGGPACAFLSHLPVQPVTDPAFDLSDVK